MTAYRSTVMFAGAVCLLISSSWVYARNASITIEDTSPLHVHSPGKPFKIKVKVDYSGSGANVSGQWHNYKGELWGTPISLPQGQTVTLSSPATHSGYYELRLKSGASDLIFPNRRAGETREYGFAILPDRSMDQRISSIKSRFGVVHGDFRDPYLPAWGKTLTWHKSQTTWLIEIDQRRARKLLELPIVFKEGWASNGHQPISQTALANLKSEISGYFRADPQVLYWELGLEENLDWNNFSATHFFSNLEKKVKVVREAADAVNPNIQLIYQLATTNVTKDVVGKFLNSEASKIFDILSLHPYRWEDDDETPPRWGDFPMPDTWLSEFLTKVKAEMQQQDRIMPIWITEIGATHHGNPGGFFGYPERNVSVVGLSREDSVRYLIQAHVIALQNGVEKIFWYNYIDRDPKREQAEDHFGLKDYWGFPKSAYVAYTQLHLTLEGKQPVGHQVLSGNVQSYHFKGTEANRPNEDVLVLWRSGDVSTEKSTIRLSSLVSGLTASRVISVVDSVGGAQTIQGESVAIGSYPIYITLSSR